MATSSCSTRSFACGLSLLPNALPPMMEANQWEGAEDVTDLDAFSEEEQTWLYAPPPLSAVPVEITALCSATAGNPIAAAAAAAAAAPAAQITAFLRSPHSQQFDLDAVTGVFDFQAYSQDDQTWLSGSEPALEGGRGDCPLVLSQVRVEAQQLLQMEPLTAAAAAARPVPPAKSPASLLSARVPPSSLPHAVPATGTRPKKEKGANKNAITKPAAAGPLTKPAAALGVKPAVHARPAAALPKPGGAIPKPATTLAKPASSVPKPASALPKPTATATEPSGLRLKPAEHNTKPAAATVTKIASGAAASGYGFDGNRFGWKGVRCGVVKGGEVKQCQQQLPMGDVTNQGQKPRQ